MFPMTSHGIKRMIDPLTDDDYTAVDSTSTSSSSNINKKQGYHHAAAIMRNSTTGSTSTCDDDINEESLLQQEEENEILINRLLLSNENPVLMLDDAHVFVNQIGSEWVSAELGTIRRLYDSFVHRRLVDVEQQQQTKPFKRLKTEQRTDNSTTTDSSVNTIPSSPSRRTDVNDNKEEDSCSDDRILQPSPSTEECVQQNESIEECLQQHEHSTDHVGTSTSFFEKNESSDRIRQGTQLDISNVKQILGQRASRMRRIASLFIKLNENYHELIDEFLMIEGGDNTNNDDSTNSDINDNNEKGEKILSNK